MYKEEQCVHMLILGIPAAFAFTKWKICWSIWIIKNLMWSSTRKGTLDSWVRITIECIRDVVRLWLAIVTLASGEHSGSKVPSSECLVVHWFCRSSFGESIWDFFRVWKEDRWWQVYWSKDDSASLPLIFRQRASVPPLFDAKLRNRIESLSLQHSTVTRLKVFSLNAFSPLVADEEWRG